MKKGAPADQRPNGHGKTRAGAEWLLVICATMAAMGIVHHSPLGPWELSIASPPFAEKLAMLVRPLLWLRLTGRKFADYRPNRGALERAAFGRPFAFFGARWGWGAIIASAIFGLTHVVDPYALFARLWQPVWLLGPVTFCLALPLAFLRERTGGVLAPGLLHALPQGLGFAAAGAMTNSNQPVCTHPDAASSIQLVPRFIGLLLLLVAPGAIRAAQNGAAAAQPPKPDRQQESIEWAVALGGRFRELHDPVVSAYALGRLGETVCAVDPAAGEELFRGALERLRLLTPDAFASARRLPVPSFTALWSTLTPAAAKCAPDLQQLADTARAKAKMADERQHAPDNLRRALSLVDSDPDRALQLAEGALSASDPTLLDIPTLTLFLSSLRDRAGDLSDEFFPEALDFIASAEQPSPGLLLELGKYLFTAPQYRDTPDVQQASEVQQVGGTSIANFAANRRSSSSDDVAQYIDAALKVVTAANDPWYDPVAAYAIAWQMLPKAEDTAPGLVDKFRDALPQIAQLAGSGAAQVQAAVGGSQAADPESGEAARERDRLTARVLAAAGLRRFDEARGLLKSVDDQSVRSQVAPLIDFAESAAALERRDVQWSFTLANTLGGGVKRALLYAGLAAASRSRDEAAGYLALGLRDTGLLPAEHRLLTTAALAAAVMRVDPESGLNTLNMFVEAANDAYTRPRRGRFDPRAARQGFSLGKGTTSTDSSLILANRRCLCEVVDTGRGRHNFPLRVPGAQATQLAGVVRNARGVDPARLEAILLALRDENLMAAGLNSLAALRLEH